MPLRLAFWALLLGPAAPTASASLTDVPSMAVTRVRRFLNVGSLFGSATHHSPYDRVAGHPVFSVTTPWGSPYMNMEKLSDLEEVVPSAPSATAGSSSAKNPQSLSEEQNEYRTVALFFLDPDDALGVHSEMKQMDNLKKADLRLTAFSLSKALRQASNLGHGLLTGLPPDPLDGTYKYDDGASLRYKIVPPKRQLYYAARCIGRERVGLWSDEPGDDAQAAVVGNSALEGLNLARRRDKRERKTPVSNALDPIRAANAHMDGYTGIPVFVAPHLTRKLPLLKRFTTGTQQEIPFFFNYEDLQESWKQLRDRARFKSRLPEFPTVEVFNLWDVLTSIDRERWNATQKRRSDPKQFVLEPLRKRFVSQSPSLDDVVFVPSSRSVRYKESISARGNSKCRLRPMR